MSERTANPGCVTGLPGALLILFIALKLLDKIDWSWWWVLSPIWICAILLAAVLAVVFVSAVVATLQERRNVRTRKP